MEQHLKKNTKEFLRNEGIKTSRQVIRRNRRSLQAECEYGAVEEMRRRDAKLNKIRRVSSRNFLTGVGRGIKQIIDYRQGISHGTPYIEPWRIQQPKRSERIEDFGQPERLFSSTVPHSRTFDEIADEAYDQRFATIS